MHKLLFYRYQGEVKLYSKNAHFTILYIIYMVYLEENRIKKSYSFDFTNFGVKCRATGGFFFSFCVPESKRNQITVIPQQLLGDIFVR